MSKTKLLIHSNAPWAPTGYGMQTALFAPRLMEHYDVQVSAFYGLEAAPMWWNVPKSDLAIKVLAADGVGYGERGLAQHAERWFGRRRDGLIFLLADVWVFNPAIWAQFDMVCWTPVDHEPTPPRVQAFFERSQAVPLAMTRLGCELLAPFDPLYCPHAVETKVLRPMGREFARQKIGVPQDAFLVGMVAANKGNPSRKSFVAVLEAFAELRRRHENAMLWLHTDLTGESAAGVPLVEVMESLGLPERCVRFTDQYQLRFEPPPPAFMALLYSAMDVLANPSTGGGFELPVLEAQACGVPVVATDFTAMRETCGAGWRVGGQRAWTPQNSWQILPDSKEILKAFEQCYKMPAERRRKLSEQARVHALQYDADTVLAEYMLPGLKQAEDRLLRRSEVVAIKRAA